MEDTSVIRRDIGYELSVCYFNALSQTVTPCLANERRGNSRVLYDNVTQKLYGKDWVIRILTTYLSTFPRRSGLLGLNVTK